MKSRVEFFYDLSSPWTYMAFESIRPVLDEAETTMMLRPVLVGGIFNAANQQLYATRVNTGTAKSKATAKWLHEWAAFAGVPMNFPSPHHPLRSVALMRFACALEDDQAALEKFSRAAFEAYFRDQRNLDDPEQCIAVANECGMDGANLGEAVQTPAVKDRLRANTDEAIGRGAFGSPTIFVDKDHMYFGNDQLPLIRARLLGKAD